MTEISKLKVDTSELVENTAKINLIDGIGDCLRVLKLLTEDIQYIIVDTSEDLANTGESLGFGNITYEEAQAGVEKIIYKCSDTLNELINGDDLLERYKEDL